METLVLLHGFTQTGASWDGVRAELGERYRVLAPDLRGHGAEAARRPISFEALVADVAALAPPRFALAGYSMGGRIALHVALEHPARVTRLALVGATAGIGDGSERAARRAADERLARRIERGGVEAFARDWAAQPLFAGQPPAVAAAAHADRMRNTATGLAAALRGVGTGAMRPLWERLGELAMPVTLIAGESDAKFRAIAERIGGQISGSELAVIPAAGHAAQLEAPVAVAAVLRGRAAGGRASEALARRPAGAGGAGGSAS